MYGQLGVGKVCLETRNTLGKVETYSLIRGFYQCKGKCLVLPGFPTDHNYSTNVFWANDHVHFAPHSFPTFHFPSYTEFYSSSWVLPQLVQTPQFRKASFFTEDLVFPISSEHSLLLLEMSQLNPQRHLSVVLAYRIYLPKIKALENYWWSLTLRCLQSTGSSCCWSQIRLEGKKWSKWFAQSKTRGNPSPQRKSVVQPKIEVSPSFLARLWLWVFREQHSTEL